MRKLFIAIATTLLFWATISYAGSSGNEGLKKSSSSSANECFEGVSRAMFSFNQAMDATIFEPIAKGYRFLPMVIRKGSSNMMGNISNLLTIPNNILQGDFAGAGNTVARLAINTTVGILGFFDPAEKIGFPDKGKEDYGQTLGFWGAGSGCYFVLPILGPTTVRDFTGTIVNLWGDPWYNMTTADDPMIADGIFKESDYYVAKGTDAVDFRAKNIESFDSLEKNSIDLYASIKSLYLQNRNKKITNSETIVETQDESDWEEIDTN
jgi:phospholipid-binding lipoprotein MlaA